MNKKKRGGDIIRIIDLGYKPDKHDIICEYSFNGEDPSALIIELTTGNLPFLEQMSVSPKVFYNKDNVLKVAFPIEFFEDGNMPQFINMVVGTAPQLRMFKDFRLLDFHLPKVFANSFSGPKNGFLKQKLGIRNRPVISTLLLPKIGMSSKECSERAFDLWVSGVDLILDSTNQVYRSERDFLEKMDFMMEALLRAQKETQEKKAYAPSISDNLTKMYRRVNILQKSNNPYFLVNATDIGLSGLAQIREATDMFMISYQGLFSLNPKICSPISQLAEAKIARLIGLDVFGVGSFSDNFSEYAILADEVHQDSTSSILLATSGTHALEQDFYGLKPVTPIISGGIHPSLVPKIRKLAGDNICIFAKSGIWDHPTGYRHGARAIRLACGIKPAWDRHPELAKARSRWG